MFEVMLDLETMGIRSDAAILSIGAVKFDLHGEPGTFCPYPDYKHFYCTIELQSCIEEGLTVDGSTMMWWLEQDTLARSALKEEPRYPLQQALANFWIWYGEESVPTWGNGADFDCVILGNAYRRLQGVAPFRFWHHRCFRTMRALVDKVQYAKPAEAHNALVDAIAQATHLQRIMQVSNFTR